jgi:protein associated with RNAse G/E
VKLKKPQFNREGSELAPSIIHTRREPITVRTFKYDGREHRSWRAELIERVGSLLILEARFEEEINHPLLGRIAEGTLSLEYYWLDRWYNVFRFMSPTGALQNFYCNVNIPPVLHHGVLSYIDLDVDILVAPDLSFTVLDEDEFIANSRKYRYSQEVQALSHAALGELVRMIETRQFPFDNLR